MNIRLLVIGPKENLIPDTTVYIYSEGWMLMVSSSFQICQILQKGATLYWFEEQQVPYAVYGDQWIGFDNEDSLHIKVSTCFY